MNTPRRRVRTPAGYTQGRDQRGGLTARQRDVLAGIRDGKTVGQIADELQLIKQAASRTLQQLVQRQLLVREKPGVYSLTELGRAHLPAPGAEQPHAAEQCGEPQQQST